MSAVENPKAFKHFMGPDLAHRLARELVTAGAPLDLAAWSAVVEGLGPLELKARVDHLAQGLRRCLPQPFPQVCAWVVGSLGPPFDPAVPNGQSWTTWPLCRWVALAGLDEPEVALGTLHVLTQRGSAELDIRCFLREHRALTWARVVAWASDPSEHLRRLASEGTRPYLPWAERVRWLIDEPDTHVELVVSLAGDPSAYVRRSVANHLNDVARDHPDKVVEACERLPADPRRAALVRHALRGLVKQGHPAALRAVGADLDAPVEVREFSASSPVAAGGASELMLTLVGEGSRAVVDLRVVDPDGRRRVVRWKALDVPAEGSVLRKRLPFRPVTVRPLVGGPHRVEVQVNGRVVAEAVVDVVATG